MTFDICCPRCGKVLGQETEVYYQLGSGKVRVYKPICPRAIEIPCPGILFNGEHCKLVFTLDQASCKT